VDATGEATLELFRSHDAYTDLLWRRLSSLSPRPCSGRVLEIGCGIGNLTRIILRTDGVEYLRAMDMDPAYVERVRSDLPDPRLHLAVALAEEYCPPEHVRPEGRFDVIVSSNVLEHIRDDVLALANLRAMLRPGGLIWLLVPAHPFLYCSLDRSLSHFRRYRRRDLHAVARAAGLEAIRVRYFNPIGALGWWVNGKLLRREMLPGGQLSLYNRYAIRLSDWIDRWNPFPLGVSLLGVLRARESAPSSP
jgi:SAM-dependent methyltransferase